MKLKHSRIELEQAKANFEELKQAKNFNEFESRWRAILNDLEKMLGQIGIRMPRST